MKQMAPSVAKPRTPARWKPICLLMILTLLFACARTPPEDALRATVDELVAAMEQRDADGVARYLADDFVGPEGLDRRGAARLALLSFRRHRQVGVALGPRDVTVRGNRATVRTTAVLTGGQGFLPESARAYEVVAGWRRDGSRWVLTSLDWSARI